MPLTAAHVAALAAQCAPSVAPTTLAAVVQVESGFDPLAIGVNGPASVRIHPRTTAEAIAEADRRITAGENIDLGLGQINVANLGRLGLSIADAFNPCSNLRAAGRVLGEAYLSQRHGPNEEQSALRVALSIYNTGRGDRGFTNGYVGKVTAAAALRAAPRDAQPNDREPAPIQAWDVFGQGHANPRLIFTSTNSGDRQ